MKKNRLRSPKASERQKEVIVEYFEENPQALRILNGTDNRAKQRVWIELTHKLNSLDGALKTTSKWGKYWNDIIIYTKTRAKTFISGECRCDRPPTETEQRILTLIGQLSLLKMWQQVWEKGVQKQAIETVVMKTESVDLQSHHSSEDDLDIAEYETMVIDPHSPGSNVHSISEHDIKVSTNEPTERILNTKEETNNGERTDEKGTHDFGSIFKDVSFMEELSENVRALGNSFNAMGAAFHNIASLLERYNSK
ncbi:unnamed protein product [Hermetia illucens]|uniref:Regulatory protein zeste n=1 Tax=Hermetia illucens TaxID=343691 RepID=A0A7R8UAP1_HERIL|nr:uncharacterized protein LOC119646609 [Hermetia illucens]CAD7077288.1 unnamed protein product [Hermetia illucens]